MENDSSERAINIYTLSDIDKNTIAQTVDSKINYWNDFNKNTVQRNLSNLQTISSVMFDIIEKYFKQKEIEAYKIAGYNFYDYKNAILLCPDEIRLRRVAENLFSIYSHFIKQIGVEIPTIKHTPKKKLLTRMFSTVKEGKHFFSDMLEDYKKNITNLGMKDTTLNFSSYSQSRMPDYDLDCNNIYYGFARIGKSTLACDTQKAFYCFREKIPFVDINEWILKKGILKKTLIHNPKQNAKDFLKKLTDSWIWIDEGYLFGDRRKAMSDPVVELTHDVNVNADNNNVVNILIQDLSDLDKRFISKANTLNGITKRDTNLLFSSHKNFAMFKDTYQIDYLQKNQHLLNSYEKGLDNLKKLPSFCYIEHFPKLQKYKKDDKGQVVKIDGVKQLEWIDDVFKEYKKDKKYWKSETLDPQTTKKQSFNEKFMIDVGGISG